MIIHNEIEQGSPEWFDLRCGKITASEFSTVMAKGRGNAPSKTRQTYMYKLAGEIITGQPSDSYSNHHMERGKEMEPEARAMYELISGNKSEQVGFISKDSIGYSPDGLIGDNGLLEIKTKLPHLQIAVLLADKVPPEHMAQLQGGLWVSEREWIDFVSYWPGLPIFIKRVDRDNEMIKTIIENVDIFKTELDEIVGKVRGL